jgi:hypothetical protein
LSDQSKELNGGAFEHHGVWWDSSAPEHRWVGILRWDPTDGAALSLTLTEGDELPPDTSEVMVGVTTSRTRITLLKCFRRHAQIVFGGAPGPRAVEVFANEVLVGFHCDRRDPLLSSASVSFQHLGEWWGQHGMKHEVGKDSQHVGVQYEPQPSLELVDDGTWRISMSTQLTGSLSFERTLMEEKATVDFRCETPQSMSAFRHRIHAFGDFLSILFGTVTNQTECSFALPTGENGRRAVAAFHGLPLYRTDGRGVSIRADALLQFADIEQAAPSMLSAWLSHLEILKYVRALYFVGAHGEGLLETKFLALTQAAEAFHRRFYDGRYMEEAAFEATVLAPMVSAIPAAVVGSHRDALSSRLKFANEVSQHKRLRDLVVEHREALRALVDQPDEWVAPIVDLRNAVTHFDPKAKMDVPPERIVAFATLLRLLLECCFLKIAGLTPDEIGEVAQRSAEYRQLKRRFFESQPPAS